MLLSGLCLVNSLMSYGYRLQFLLNKLSIVYLYLNIFYRRDAALDCYAISIFILCNVW